MSDETWTETHRKTIEQEIALWPPTSWRSTALRAALAEIARLTAELEPLKRGPHDARPD
jgi:hypothetical protein